MYKLPILGIASIEAVQIVPPINNSIEIGKLIIQVVIGIATLVKMFRKPKINNNGTESNS